MTGLCEECKNTIARSDEREALEGPESAIEHLGKEIDQNPCSGVSLRMALLLDSVGREASAVAHYSKALEGDGLDRSQREMAVVCLASSYRNLKKPDEAIAAISKHYATGTPATRCMEALCLFDKGDVKRAFKRMSEALLDARKDPSFDDFEGIFRSKLKGVPQRKTPLDAAIREVLGR